MSLNVVRRYRGDLQRLAMLVQEHRIVLLSLQATLTALQWAIRLWLVRHTPLLRRSAVREVALPIPASSPARPFFRRSERDRAKWLRSLGRPSGYLDPRVLAGLYTQRLCDTPPGS